MNNRFAFIVAHARVHAIRLLCRVLHVSRSWFHAWRRTANDRAERASRSEALVGEIRAIFEDSKRRCAERLRGGAAAKVVGAMIAKGLLQEVDAEMRKGKPVWRET